MADTKHQITFTTKQHWQHYADFCLWEIALGGPSTQLATVVKMAEGQPEEEQLWRALCYIAVYNVPYGEVLWRFAPRDGTLDNWLKEAFAGNGVVTRFERRCLRRADWMIEYFAGVRVFLEEWPALKEHVAKAMSPEVGYELVWERLMTMPRVGRYISIRLVELLRRLGLPVITPDIRPRDAHTSRSTLAMLFPGRELDTKNNAPAALAAVNAAATEALARLHGEFGVSLDYYQLQVTLCEYRQSWRSKKQYPGRSLDSELSYARRAEAAWHYRSDIWAARAALFPAQCLGELAGWEGTRKTVGAVLANQGYTWSDLVFDYVYTKDMAAPVRWE
jgi:hypothetical protein